MKNIVSALLIVLVNTSLLSQIPGKNEPDKKTDWWGDTDGSLNQ